VALAGSTIRQPNPDLLPSFKPPRLPPDAFPALLALSVVMSFGMHRLFSAPLPSPTSEIKLALIQPSIDQTLIWDTNANAQRFETVMRLSRQALESKPDVLVWPESSLPEVTEDNIEALARLAISNKVWIVFCADDYDPPPAKDKPPKFYNASFLLSPQGRIAERYRKNRLVIFGEYIPLADWLPFLKWFTPIDGGYSTGGYPTPFQLDNLKAQLSVLICFEDVFPQEARRHVGSMTQFLLNLTNDGWFGRGAAQWQQAAAALFRAIENGVPLVRCTNNGLTCWIDSFGRIQQIGSPDNIYGPGYLIANIPLLSSEERGRTFYNRHGNLFGGACAGWIALLLARSIIARRLRRKTGETVPHSSVVSD
jgi:apolipoprotein N-acyltransferase